MIGLETWFNNFTQYIWKAQTKEGLADIQVPRAEYAIYWTMKCAELSAFIGGAVVHPIYRMYLIRRLTPETTTNNSRKVIRTMCRKIQGRFLIAGLIAGPVLSVAWSEYKGWTESDLKKRCYQIRCNKDSLTLDRMATTFFLVGWYWKRFQGGVDGINIAISYWLFDRTILQPYTSQLLRDKFKPEDTYATPEEYEADKDKITRFWRDIAITGNPKNDLRPDEGFGKHVR